MITIHLEKDYEVKCTLGTMKDIEKMFGKPFFSIAAGLDKLTADEQIKLLYSGVRRADSGVLQEDFLRDCEDNMGLGDLTDYLEQFMFQLQYPGLSHDEIQEKI